VHNFTANTRRGTRNVFEPDASLHSYVTLRDADLHPSNV
jgi:hypothetical protein